MPWAEKTVVALPFLLSDATGANRISTLSVGYSVKEPDKTPAISITVAFEHSFAAGSRLNAYMYLPAVSWISDCYFYFDSDDGSGRCELLPMGSARTFPAERFPPGIRAQPAVALTMTIPAGASEVTILVDALRDNSLQVAPGWAMDANRTSADIYLPEIIDIGDDRASGAAVPVNISYRFASAGLFEWSDSPAVIYWNEVTWSRASTDDRASRIRGSNKVALERDSTRTFLSGLLLGIAGGAVIPIVQGLSTPDRPRRRLRDRHTRT